MAHDAAKVTYHGHELPATWLVGGFALEVAVIEAGELDEQGTTLRDAAGQAWLRLPHARAHPMIDRRSRRPDLPRITHMVEVVGEVVHPETEIAFADAIAIRPDARVGDSIAVDFIVDHSQLAEIVGLGRGVVGWLDTDPPSARFLVEFQGADVDFVTAPEVGVAARIVADYPAVRRPIEIALGGFTVVVSTIRLTHKGARGNAQLRLPESISDATSCQPAEIDLGTIVLSPSSDYSIEAPAATFGPWLLGETGLVVEGTGYVLDLSSSASPAPHPPAWRGLLLHNGNATGSQHVPDPCNTGYLRGDFTFADAVIVASGFTGSLDLAAPVMFTALNPLGQVVELTSGWLDVQESRIAGGELQNGSTQLPPQGVWEGAGGASVRLRVDALEVQPDLDLAGVVADPGHELSWGELTRPGEEVVAFTAVNDTAFLFLPAGPFASYSPIATGSFSAPAVSVAQPAASLAQLDAHAASGVTFAGVSDLLVHSPDRPGGAANPLKVGQVDGWLRVGVTGIDGELAAFSGLGKEDYGDPARKGYVGGVPLSAFVSYGDGETHGTLAQLVTSAVTESHLTGYLEIPHPANISRLRFDDLKLTSTANLVGGDVNLAGGVRLDYWDLALVSTGPPGQAGVLSVRTGRVLFLAAGIAEPVHFARPFGLTWGELLADGNLGQLFFDLNDWGQRLDGLPFHPDALQLSPFVAGANPTLAVSGSIVFRYFGVAYVNIEDAALVSPSAPRPYPRWVESPKSPVTPTSRPTDLALSGIWHDATTAKLAEFLCVDAHVGYNTTAQRGFLGTGGAEFGFLHSLDLDITVEIQAAATDIRISAAATHDLDLSTLGRLGTLNEIVGNVRIEGTTIARLTMYGVIEQSAAGPGAVFTPKAGYSVETNFTVTPTSLDLYVAGDMLLSLGVTEVEASGTAHLLFDFAVLTAEGELIGRVDGDHGLAGISGEGQLTWHMSPAMQYLQGRMRVQVFSVLGGQALEGGFFVGNNVPNALAWVLDTTDPHFRMSRALLPPTITGVYGYGFASWGINLYVLGGGIDIFVGAGAFSAPVTGMPLLPFAGPLPFVVGACGIHVYGEILGGLVSASGWANLSLRGPIPLYFEGSFGLRGCVAWVFCASATITARLSSAGFELF